MSPSCLAVADRHSPARGRTPPSACSSPSGTPAEAELAAAECVIAAETKDHLNWELLHTVADCTKGETKATILELLEQVEKQEDHHLYHTTGWARELWIQALGPPSVPPPPEDVETAIGAARAKNARRQML